MTDNEKFQQFCAEPRLTEEQAKGLAERIPQTGSLKTLDDEPLCMAKRIEELEAQVRALTTPEGWQLVPWVPTRAMREAFHEAHEEWESGDNWRLDCPDHQWRAMLAAAPKPEAK